MEGEKNYFAYQYILLIDISCIIIAFILSIWIRFDRLVLFELGGGLYGVGLIIVLATYILIYYLYLPYKGLFHRGFLDELIVVVKTNIILGIALTGIMFLFQMGSSYSRLFFILFAMVNCCINYLGRIYYKISILTLFKKSNICYQLMVVTTSDQVNKIIANIKKDTDWSYEVACFAIIDQNLIGKHYDGVEVKADMNNLLEVAKLGALDGVLIHIPNGHEQEVNLEDLIISLQSMGLAVNLSIKSFGMNLNAKQVQKLSGFHVLTFSTKLFAEDKMLLKRMMDILGGLVGCLLTIMITIFVAPAIYIESPGPIFFSQIRIGKNGRRFRIYKFRSMHTDAEERLKDLMAHNEMDGLMFKMENDPRITKVGNFLRKTSLDEFPQFLNVLKGDMSLVGTRPPTENEFVQYEGRHKRRLSLKCGLTGLWQVSGRSDITDFEEVVKLDLQYIDNWSLKEDIKIILKTVWVVLFGRGAK